MLLKKSLAISPNILDNATEPYTTLSRSFIIHNSNSEQYFLYAGSYLSHLLSSYYLAQSLILDEAKFFYYSLRMWISSYKIITNNPIINKNIN